MDRDANTEAGSPGERQAPGLVLESHCVKLCDIQDEALIGGADVC